MHPDKKLQAKCPLFYQIPLLLSFLLVLIYLKYILKPGHLLSPSLIEDIYNLNQKENYLVLLLDIHSISKADLACD